MSFSISPFREAGSLINQPVTSHHNAVIGPTPMGHQQPCCGTRTSLLLNFSI
jgi:hypothetical protein